MPILQVRNIPVRRSLVLCETTQRSTSLDLHNIHHQRHAGPYTVILLEEFYQQLLVLLSAGERKNEEVRAVDV